MGLFNPGGGTGGHAGAGPAAGHAARHHRLLRVHGRWCRRSSWRFAGSRRVRRRRAPRGPPRLLSWSRRAGEHRRLTSDWWHDHHRRRRQGRGRLRGHGLPRAARAWTGSARGPATASCARRTELHYVASPAGHLAGRPGGPAGWVSSRRSSTGGSSPSWSAASRRRCATRATTCCCWTSRATPSTPGCGSPRTCSGNASTASSSSTSPWSPGAVLVDRLGCPSSPWATGTGGWPSVRIDDRGRHGAGGRARPVASATATIAYVGTVPARLHLQTPVRPVRGPSPRAGPARPGLPSRVGAGVRLDRVRGAGGRRPRCSRPDAGPPRSWRPRTRWRSGCCRRPAGLAWTCPATSRSSASTTTPSPAILDLTTVRQDVDAAGPAGRGDAAAPAGGGRRGSGRPDRQLRARGARLHRTPAGLTPAGPA